ncbi:PIG-L family deacetylase [Subtercola frigoramans]|uniref:N-acetyl-1-D-myo-inositol-2-amino-2-deoxy-alpha-D-glucopyranoside deacetylase n=1 Tax=Subtercola frigoramans TaxID=120298 RepID=A0ABS2L259_9MICO|nr:PIG-L family deacetylase [Subtercola frigoramans]MBM7471165.1 N-acetyl-1-D-myo-inositol-2-amino-2-deoxy-alpha-D-glucopyranoside deacetylase [Subtercola frigoramans]
MLFPELSDPARTDEAVLLLHAHPDDETLATGGLMARLAADGYSVVLVTGTRGERGEVVPGPLKHLEGTPQLAERRVFELAEAMRELGVADHRFLGESIADGVPPRVYSDSGMQWGPAGTAIAADDAPVDALSLAPLDEVVEAILRVIDETGPAVLVSYDEKGGYGHPDHVRMHDAATAASSQAGLPLYMVVPQADPSQGGDLEIPLEPYRHTVMRALAQHQTQLTLDGDDIVLSGGQRHTLAAFERYRLAATAGTGSSSVSVSLRDPEHSGPAVH